MEIFYYAVIACPFLLLGLMYYLVIIADTLRKCHRELFIMRQLIERPDETKRLRP